MVLTGKIRQHFWKKRLQISKIAQFKNDFLKTNQLKIQLCQVKSRNFTEVCVVGCKFVPPPNKGLSNFAPLWSNSFPLFGRITFKLGKFSYSKAHFPAVLIRDIRPLLFIKVVRNRERIYYPNSKSRERKKNDYRENGKTRQHYSQCAHYIL